MISPCQGLLDISVYFLINIKDSTLVTRNINYRKKSILNTCLISISLSSETRLSKIIIFSLLKGLLIKKNNFFVCSRYCYRIFFQDLQDIPLAFKSPAFLQRPLIYDRSLAF
jgi:hypothetical protein